MAAGSTTCSAPRSPYRSRGRWPIRGSASRSRTHTPTPSSGRSGTCASTSRSSAVATADEVVEEPAKDLIAVEYRHTTARAVSGASAPDPQLHSHVVITSAIREDDRIVAVASRPVFRAAGELGAFYRSVLAEELAREGYRIDQGTGRDGKYFEIAGVPEELREAFSGRSREVARAADRFRARYGRAPERGELRNLALENRRAKQLATRSDLENAWRETASSIRLRSRRGVAAPHWRPSIQHPSADRGSDRGAADRTARRLRDTGVAYSRFGADRRGADTARTPSRSRTG